MDYQRTINVLTSHGIKPSQQRIAIMDYLLDHDIHPTIEDVFNGLCPQLPTLSKTTVYNTLRMFSEHKAIRMITIDDHHVCYDGINPPHNHFLCKKCGRIFNLKDDTVPTIENANIGKGFCVDEVQLYYKGICPECAKAMKN